MRTRIFFWRKIKTDIRLETRVEMIKSVSRNLNYEFLYIFFLFDDEGKAVKNMSRCDSLNCPFHDIFCEIWSWMWMACVCVSNVKWQKKTSWHFDTRFLSIFIIKWNFLWSKKYFHDDRETSFVEATPSTRSRRYWKTTNSGCDWDWNNWMKIIYF